MRVFVYRNLHKEGNVYSIKSIDGISKGRVIGYAHGICLENCQLIVNKAGRERVLKEKRKNVHAGIVGDLVAIAGYQVRMHLADFEVTQYNDESWLKTFEAASTITYNPFLYTSFVYKGSGVPILKADRVTFFHSRVEAKNK